MTSDARAAASAKRLIEKFGQVVAVNHTTNGAYDPATSGITSTVTTQSAPGVELSYTEAQIDGTLIQRGDKKVMWTAAGTVAPRVDDTCVLGGVTYNVVSVSTLSPAGLPIFHTLQLRA